jgi:hypothetical protein
VVNNYARPIRFWGENNGLRSAAAMTDAFILKKQWKDEVDLYDRMAASPRPQVVAFAKEDSARTTCASISAPGRTRRPTRW